MLKFTKNIPPYIAPKNKDGRCRIVVPGGIGDIYWIMVKLESFLKKNNIQVKPHIHILVPNKLWQSAQLRALPFIKMIPFVQVNENPTVLMYPKHRRIPHLDELYNSMQLQTIYENFLGYEYFICYNGPINQGIFIEDHDDLECNWFFDMNISEVQHNYMKNCQNQYGKYAVFYFSMAGSFITQNLAHFPIDKLAEGINHLVNSCNLTPVFVGAWWDLKYPYKDPENIDYLPILINKIPKAINLVGKTSIEEVFGVLRGAEIVSGYHCGLTNMAIMFKKKTVLLWSPHRFPANTSLAIAPPETRNKTYIPLFTEGLTIDKYSGTMINLYHNNEVHV